MLNRRLVPGNPMKIEFTEPASDPHEQEPGLIEFLVDRSLSGNVTPGELRFLQGLRFNGTQPTRLYFYRELQNLRDPLHVRAK